MQVFAAKLASSGTHFRINVPSESNFSLWLMGLNTRKYGGVGAGGGRPLPAAVVAGKVVIDEVLGKPFAPPPIHQQVLGEELRGHHAKSVVHPAGGHQQRGRRPPAGSRFVPRTRLEFISLLRHSTASVESQGRFMHTRGSRETWRKVATPVR